MDVRSVAVDDIARDSQRRGEVSVCVFVTVTLRLGPSAFENRQ